MIKIKIFAVSILSTCLFFVAGFFFAGSVSAAPRLYFDPETMSPQKNTDIQVNVLIDVETNAAFGADATINFPSEITVKSVSDGGFFTDFSFAQSSGKLELHGFFSASFATKTGSGKFASITMTSSKDLGSSVLNFSCTAGGSDTEILNSSGQNILACSSLNQLTLTYPTSDTNVSTTGPTNSCGGTCGSHYNCNSGLFCNNGYCRNPDCPTSTTCGCVATPKPTTKATATPKPNIKSTPQVVTLSKFTPMPSSTPQPPTPTTPSQTEVPENQKIDYARVAIWVAGSLFALFLLFVILKFFKGKNNPPKITPPTTDGSTESFQTYNVAPPIQNPQEPPPFPSVP